MLPENRISTHPGEILQNQFLSPLGLTQVALAEHLGVPVQRINEIVRGKRGVTPATAWLLAQAFDTTPELWIDLQASHDLVVNRPEKAVPPLQKVELSRQRRRSRSQTVPAGQTLSQPTSASRSRQTSS